jgi:hypothetical protein
MHSTARSRRVIRTFNAELLLRLADPEEERWLASRGPRMTLGSAGQDLATDHQERAGDNLFGSGRVRGWHDQSKQNWAVSNWAMPQGLVRRVQRHAGESESRGRPESPCWGGGRHFLLSTPNPDRGCARSSQRTTYSNKGCGQKATSQAIEKSAELALPWWLFGPENAIFLQP